MAKLIYIVTIISLVLICSLISVHGMETINIHNATKCYNEMLVKVKVDDDVKYEVVGFNEKEENLWQIGCKGGEQKVDVTVYNNESRELDFTVYYHIAKLLPVVKDENITGLTKEEIENDNNLRQFDYNDIVFNLEKKKTKEPFVMPKFSGGVTIAGIIIGILLLIVLVSVVAIKWILKDSEEEKQVNEASLRGIRDPREPTREEVEEFIRNNT